MHVRSEYIIELEDWILQKVVEVFETSVLYFKLLTETNYLSLSEIISVQMFHFIHVNVARKLFIHSNHSESFATSVIIAHATVLHISFDCLQLSINNFGLRLDGHLRMRRQQEVNVTD